MKRQRGALSRRALLGAVAAVPLAARASETLEILPGLRLIRGAVNTAVFERNGKSLMIDCGDVAAAPGGAPVTWVLFTHHHRDQASGAARLAAAGAKLAVPASEANLFTDANGFWDSSDTILFKRYNFRPHAFTLLESVPVTRTVKEGDALEWEDLRFEVIDTPGHTDGSVSYFVEVQGKRVAFTGDLIHSPGKIRDMYSLQKALPGMPFGYVGFGGAAGDVKASLDRVLERKPDLLVPSHGEVMKDPGSSVAELKTNLDAVMENFFTTAYWRVYFPNSYPLDKHRMLPPLDPKPMPNWFRHIESTTQAIVAEDGTVFLSDCGSLSAINKLAEMIKAKEVGPIDAIWITHYHNDHTEFVNLARQRFGAKVYVQKEMVDIIEHPTAYNMPCLIPEAIHVDRVTEHGETMHWKGFRFTTYYFPGQTLYHAGMLVERDGFKLFLSGDSIGNWGLDDYCSENRNFQGPDVGYEKCLKLLLEIKPDLMVSAHWGGAPQFAFTRLTPMSTNYLRKTIALLEQRRRLYGRLLPYNDPNFGTDPFWIRAYPYRQTVLPGSPVEMEARIMNHSARPMSAQAGLRLPEGWGTEQNRSVAEIPPRTEGKIRLRAVAPRASSRRHVLGIDVSVNREPLGEFAEAIVDTLS